MPPPRFIPISARLGLGGALISRRALIQSRISVRQATTSSSSTSSSASSGSQRKAITLTSDTGRIPWGSLSTGEKAVRSTQQTFNFALVLVGIGLTVGVGYVLFVEVFSPSSKTAVFNRTVTRIRADPAAVAALNWSLFGAGDRGARIAAFGEGSWSRWARNRTISSTTETDRRGVEHLRMHFYVAGPKGQGTVWVHMTRPPGADWEYFTLALDVEGQERLVLENAEKTRSDGVKGGKMFGVRWW
ncbi:hypothetical protein ANO11243_082970 [Dothideomycetidae sp. 11243]|nr:hypothetical protein ANO11243_082970 [fungal sp. No.11243]